MVISYLLTRVLLSTVQHVEKPDLIGVEFLWDLYLALPSVDASLDGGHSKSAQATGALSTHPGDMVSAVVVTAASTSSPSRPQTPASGASTTTSASTVATTVLTGAQQDAVKLARQLLLDVHWGQLAPRLRRDAEACYRRFFDACRKRLRVRSFLYVWSGLVT